MNNPTTFQVRDFTGCPFAVSAEDGKKLHDAIAPLLKAGRPVALSFAGIETMIAAFLGAAIGRLYGEMAYADADAPVSTDCLPEVQMQSLKRVVANSKRYYQNKEAYDRAWAEVAEDDVTLERAVET
jgi:hypothetical protein